jgi:branched-chain amino acid transport system substrate-binding protein
MSKKSVLFISLAIVLTMVTVLVAGCGGSTESKDIKIGGNFELTGGVATFGQASVNGAKLAFKQINAAGGVLGKQIAFVQADNKSEPSESTNAITKLITQDKVVAVLGAVTSSDTLAAVPVAMQYKIPLVTSMSTNPKVTFENGKVNDYAFRACFIDPFQGTVMANFATNTLKAKNVAIYIDNSSDYAKGLAEFFEKAFVASGGTIVSKEAYLQKDQDFKATLTKIRSSNPDAIFIPGYYQEVGLIAKQARELGIMVPLMGGDGWDSPKLTEIAGKQALNNSFFSNHYTPEDKDPKVVKFVEDYKAEYGQVPDALAALGYDSAMMIVDAIKRANSADPEKIKEALVQTKGLQGVSGMITLNDHHDAVKSAVVIEMIDGAQVFKEKVNP